MTILAAVLSLLLGLTVCAGIFWFVEIASEVRRADRDEMEGRVIPGPWRRR